MEYHYMHHSWPVVTIQATDHRGCFAANAHRIVLASETDIAFYGWPDPTDKRNSEHWQPGVSKQIAYLKFAWEKAEVA